MHKVHCEGFIYLFSYSRHGRASIIDFDPSYLTQGIMVHEEAENTESVSSAGKMSRNPSSSSATQEDVFMELDSSRFEKRSNAPMRRVSCISSFGRKASTDSGIRKENLNFGGRRFSMDLSRPRLSIASKRDRSLNKLYFEMETGTRKVGEDTGTLVHDLVSTTLW